ncbi:MAG TPA: hypothetical protein V6D22_12895 [Candidatus Obscuribacterales bacterium]
MAARCALLVIGLLLITQSPGLAKPKLHPAVARSTPAAAVHLKVKAKSASASDTATTAAQQTSIKSQVREEPAVLLQPDGTEEDSQPSKALYTDSDDVG